MVEYANHSKRINSNDVRYKMKQRKLVAQEVVNGTKRILGLDDHHAVCESRDDAIELINAGTVTIGDVNSGYSVRRQRELRGSESQIDKFAKTFGFDNADAMELELGTRDPIAIINMARQAKLANMEKSE